MKSVDEVVAALAECSRHADILRHARSGLGNTRFTAESAGDLSAETIQLLDQCAYRFGKLQDTLGMRVFPGILDLTEEPFPESTPFAQKLQRLERLNVIPSVSQWRTLRELRNHIAHEYLDAPALKAAALNRFLDGIDDLLEVWKQVSGYAKEQGCHTRSTGPTMRLTDQQIDSIRHIVREAAGPAARTRVFGSRLRDDVSGGDLDLLVELPDPVAAPAELAARLSARLSRSLHGRSVNVLLLAPNLRRLPIHDIALRDGQIL